MHPGRREKGSRFMQGNSLLKQKLIIFIGVIGISFSGVLAKLSNAPSIHLVMCRMFFTVLLMAVPFMKAFRKEREQLKGRTLIYCLISGIFLAVHFACYFQSVRLASVSSGSLLVNTSVFFVPMITVPFLGEKLSGKALAGILVTFLGGALVAGADSGGGSNVLLGDAFALLGALFMAIYTVMGRLCRKTISTALYTTIVYFIAGVVALLLVLAQQIPLTGYSLQDYACAFGMAVFCTLLGHSIFNWGLKYLSAAYISTVKLGEPVISAFFAFLLFGEVPGLLKILGGAVILFGVAWTVRYSE